MSAVRTTRDWRGHKYHVSSCSTEELLNLLTDAIMTTDQVAKFIAEVRPIGPARRDPLRPYDVA